MFSFFLNFIIIFLRTIPFSSNRVSDFPSNEDASRSFRPDGVGVKSVVFFIIFDFLHRLIYTRVAHTNARDATLPSRTGYRNDAGCRPPSVKFRVSPVRARKASSWLRARRERLVDGKRILSGVCGGGGWGLSLYHRLRNDLLSRRAEHVNIILLIYIYIYIGIEKNSKKSLGKGIFVFFFLRCCI